MKKKIIKVISVFMVLNIFLIPLANFVPGNQIKIVRANEATPQLLQGSVLAVGSMILLMMQSQEMLEGGITLTVNQINQLTNSLQEKLITADPAGQLINQANNLGIALKNGADKAAITAMTSGALIYAYLDAMQSILFPVSDSLGTVGNYYATVNNYDVYVFATHFNNTEKFYISSAGFWPTTSATNCIYVGSLDTNNQYVTGQNLQFYLKNKLTGEVINKNYSLFSNLTFRVINSGYETVLYNMFTGGSSFYYPKATTVSSLESVNIPTVLPQTIINNITNYDGISDLVLGIPEGYTIPIDNSITVNPGTIIDNPPIDVPVDPPVEPTLIGTVAAILAGLTPIAGFLEYILAGQVSLTESIEAGLTGVIDGIGDIAGTLTGGITSSLTDIQSSISTLTAPATETINLDPVKNIPKVLFTKFPFSIPWDLYNVYNLMATDNRSPPEFLLGIQMSKSSTLSSLGAGDINMEVKLENYEQIAGIIRVGELLLFVLGLIFATKKLIWG